MSRRSTRWTEADIQRLGLAKQVREARCTPTAARWGDRQRSVDVARVFAVALHERFPGVFVSCLDLGVTWGNINRQIGVQWGGFVPTDINKGWVIVPVWFGDLHTRKGVWSERKLQAVLKRIGECLTPNSPKRDGAPQAVLKGLT